ncbi:hypothetical protein AGMMS49944_09650 [Spirochaetia bacterium]|nr:hypothetical protein AGMMS49944_09650 [Spirochaetia bacterium]
MKPRTLNEEQQERIDRAVIKLITISQCMEIFEDQKRAGDITNGFQYIINDAVVEINRVMEGLKIEVVDDVMGRKI